MSFVFIYLIFGKFLSIEDLLVITFFLLTTDVLSNFNMYFRRFSRGKIYSVFLDFVS